MQSLEAKGTASGYRKSLHSAITRILKEVPFRTANDLDQDKLVQWLSNAIDSKGKKLGGRNRNHFRNSMNRFTEYLVSENYRSHNPFTKIKPVNEAIGRETKRRAFTTDELTKLFEVTLTRPLKENQTIRRGANKGTQTGKLRAETIERLKLLGKERYLIYRTLLYTGLRINELRTLTVARLDLTPKQETIHLEAHNEKTRQGNTIPLRVDLAEELRGWIQETGKEPSDLLFNVTGSILKVLDLDLEGAGIVKVNQRGGKLDIHSFRMTLNTMMRKEEISDAVIKRMMRHAGEGMTDLYTDDTHLPTRKAINSLTSVQVIFACATKCATNSDFGGHFEASSGKMGKMNSYEDQKDDFEKVEGKPLENAEKREGFEEKEESGWRDLNPRPLAPQASALAKLRYSPNNLTESS